MWVNDQAITPSFPYLLNMVHDPLLPYFHYFFLMLHYSSCLISVLLSLQNYPSLFVVWFLPYMLLVAHIWLIATLSMEWGYRQIIRCYPNSKIIVTKIHYPYGANFVAWRPLVSLTFSKLSVKYKAPKISPKRYTAKLST